MSKLTLSVDARAVARAKRYARAQSTSLSSLVEKLLDLVAAPSSNDREPPPVLARLRGSLKAGTYGDYHRYLERKYR